jgi:dihydrofolate reductase
MSLKVSAYFAASLDGYIARLDGSIDWLNEASAIVPEGEDCGFQAFMEPIDILVMGRKTYEQVLTFGQWPYGETPVIVLSRNPISFPVDAPGVVSCSSESPRALCDRLSREGVGHIYVDGGTTIQGFLAEGLIDEMTVTVIPVVLGKGISPFGSQEKDIKCTQLRAKVFDFGFVQMTYSVQANA